MSIRRPQLIQPENEFPVNPRLVKVRNRFAPRPASKIDLSSVDVMELYYYEEEDSSAPLGNNGGQSYQPAYRHDWTISASLANIPPPSTPHTTHAIQGTSIDVYQAHEARTVAFVSPSVLQQTPADKFANRDVWTPYLDTLVSCLSIPKQLSLTFFHQKICDRLVL